MPRKPETPPVELPAISAKLPEQFGNVTMPQLAPFTSADEPPENTSWIGRAIIDTSNVLADSPLGRWLNTTLMRAVETPDPNRSTRLEPSARQFHERFRAGTEHRRLTSNEVELSLYPQAADVQLN